MTTQNHTTSRLAYPALTPAQFPEGGGLNVGAGPCYYPTTPGGTPATGLAMSGWDHIGITGKITCALNNSLTVTVEGSTDGVTWTDITLSGWNTATGAFGTASFACVGAATLNVSIDFDNYNYRYIRVKLVTVAGGADCSLDCWAQRRKE